MSELALEELVSSKIRVRLLAHLLTHPEERVYLRGIARALQLPITPVRRELYRLTAMGLLKTEDEGSLKWYWVDRMSPEFPRLLGLIEHRTGAQPNPAIIPTAPTATPTTIYLPVPTSPAAKPAQWGWWRWGLGVSSTAFLLTLAVLVYMLHANTSLLAVTERAMARTLAAAVRPLSASPRHDGPELESSRWRVIPGSWGGYTPAMAGPPARGHTNQ